MASIYRNMGNPVYFARQHEKSKFGNKMELASAGIIEPVEIIVEVQGELEIGKKSKRDGATCTSH